MVKRVSLPSAGMNMTKARLCTVLLLVAFSAAPFVGAAERANDSDARSADKKTEQTSDRQPDIAAGLPDVEACKREARGLEGPARGNFMTQCLKQQSANERDKPSRRE